MVVLRLDDLGAAANKKVCNRCWSQHACLEEQLGVKRPLTGWEHGGLCKLPDYSWTGGAENFKFIFNIRRPGASLTRCTSTARLAQPGKRVRGSSEVANIWIAAGLALSAGAGMYFTAVCGTAMVVLRKASAT
ncbi:hypothetical protein JKP88DRAFT_250185 [Tribonema minus]|uniref:Uncharacterized protein n=1 Tax=Tribonema minus TaxID=303371 RepID=A0A835YHB7_9STRA|nr:hypothetical protein JKP88DRAFT_250185 [Tribonema minus]